MVNTNTKIAGNSRVLTGIFYAGGADSKASLTTSVGTNANLYLEAKEPGIIGNDISLKYVDTGLENVDFALDIKNSQDIICTLERKNSRAFFETNNTETESNVRFVAASAGTGGNDISITIDIQTDTPANITACAIATKVVTITTAAAHGFTAGDVVGISGLNEELVCGCFQVSEVTSTTQFKYGLKDSLTATVATGYGTASKAYVSVSTKDITIRSPQDDAGSPMLTPAALKKAWGRYSSAKALCTVEVVGDLGDERIGFVSKTFLTGGKASAITTTALDVKREIEASSLASELVDVFVPSGTTGMGLVSAMVKTYLSGGSNLVKSDPDDQLVTVKIYDAWENELATIESDDITRKSTGIYECVYTPDQKYRSIYVEFAGEMDGVPVLSRQQIDLEWANSDI